MKWQLHSMSGILLVHAAVCQLLNIGYFTYHKMSATVNKSQVPYLEMLGTYYPTAGIHETVRYSNVIYMTCNRYGWNNTGSL